MASLAVVEQVGLAMIFATSPEGPRVAHAPVEWTGETTLQLHLAQRNLIEPHLHGAMALCLVNGPQAYISPGWHSDPTNVATWYQVAVELEDAVREVEERAQLAGELHASGATGVSQWMWSQAA